MCVRAGRPPNHARLGLGRVGELVSKARWASGRVLSANTVDILYLNVKRRKEGRLLRGKERGQSPSAQALMGPSAPLALRTITGTAWVSLELATHSQPPPGASSVPGGLLPLPEASSFLTGLTPGASLAWPSRRQADSHQVCQPQATPAQASTVSPPSVCTALRWPRSRPQRLPLLCPAVFLEALVGPA